MARGSGHLVRSGSDCWGRSEVSNGTEFPSYQPNKPNIWNDMDFFPLLILLGEEHQMMPGLFIYFAGNKTQCKSQ